MNWVNNYAELKYWEEIAGIAVATIFVIGWAIVLFIKGMLFCFLKQRELFLALKNDGGPFL